MRWRRSLRGSGAFLVGVAWAKTAVADPLPVHTPTAQVSARPTVAQRLSLADAVSRVLSEALPEVLSGAESHTRVETLCPSALSCAEPGCVAGIRTALGARGVVLVRIEPGARRRLRVAVDVLDARGETLAHGDGEETVGEWEDALALARVVAAPVRERLRAIPHEPAPTVTPAQTPTVAAPAPHPTHAEGTVPTHEARADGRSVAGVEDATVGRRRPAEAVLGGALLLGGALAATMGSVSLARDGSPAPGMAIDNAERVYVAGTRDYVLLGVGAASVAVGAVLLIDGVRTHGGSTSGVRAVGVWAPGVVGAAVHGVF